VRVDAARDILMESAMSRRGLKIAALVLSGGVLLQAGGCIYLFIEQAVGYAIASAVSTLIRSILGTGTTT
jgi:hypothetical protein